MTNERFEIDTEQWAVVPRVPTDEMVAAGMAVPCQDAEHDDFFAVYSSMIAAAPQPEQAQQSDAWAPHSINYDRSIHSNPSAEAWAALFIQTFPGLADKHDLMLGWFANAMMAMHDHLMRQPAPPNVQALVEALKDALEYLQHHLPDEALAPHRAALAAFQQGDSQ